MSHFTKIKTVLKDKECLLESLKNLDYKVEVNTSIKGYQGKTTHGDIVIKTNSSYDVGFVKNATDTYDIVADWYGARRAIGKSKKVFTEEVQKEYTINKTIKTVRKKGYRIQSRKNIAETEEVKLIVVKRGWQR